MSFLIFFAFLFVYFLLQGINIALVFVELGNGVVCRRQLLLKRRNRFFGFADVSGVDVENLLQLFVCYSADNVSDLVSCHGVSFLRLSVCYRSSFQIRLDSFSGFRPILDIKKADLNENRQNRL